MALDFVQTGGGAASDYVDFGDTTILDGLSAITLQIDMWREGGGTTNQSIWRKDGCITPLQKANGGADIQAVLWANGLQTHPIASSNFAEGAWHRIGITWINSRGSVRFYKWGTLIGTSASTASTGTLQNSANAMRIGATEGAGEAFDGKLANMHLIPAVEFDAAQMAVLALNPPWPMHANHRFWPMDENNAATVRALFGGALNGTITGADWAPHTPWPSTSGPGPVIYVPAAGGGGGIIPQVMHLRRQFEMS